MAKTLASQARDGGSIPPARFTACGASSFVKPVEDGLPGIRAVSGNVARERGGCAWPRASRHRIVHPCASRSFKPNGLDPWLNEPTAGATNETIKNLRDQDATFREACVVLSGSSARDLREATDDLADRRGGIVDTDRMLLPMGFRAFCRALGDFDGLPEAAIRPRDFLTLQTEQAVYELEPWVAALDDAWQLFLEVGGFPRAVGEFVQAGEVEPGFVEGLWHVVTGDALRSTTMSETEVAVLLDRLVQNLCSPVNASAVATDVGLRDGDRVNERIHDLVSHFLAWRCYRLRGDLPNPAAQRKVYFIDPLIAQLAYRRNPRFRDPDSTKLNDSRSGSPLLAPSPTSSQPPSSRPTA